MAKLNLLYSSSEIQEKVTAYANKINAELTNQPLICIGILNGALFFMSDLLKKINGHVIMDTISASSYQGNKSGNQVKFHKWITKNITNQHVLVVEDIVHTGLTLMSIIKQLKLMNPKSIRVVAVIDKFENHPNLDFEYETLFSTSANFLVGYGLDYNDQYRQLPDIYEIIDY